MNRFLMATSSSQQDVPRLVEQPVIVAAVASFAAAIVVLLLAWTFRSSLSKATARWAAGLAITATAGAPIVAEVGYGKEITSIAAVVAVAIGMVEQVIERILLPRELDKRSEQEHQEQIGLELERLGTASCPQMSNLEPVALGIRPTSRTNRLDPSGLPTYVRRDIDPLVRQRLTSSDHRAADLVVVAGHPKTGKTRCLYEAVKDARPRSPIFVLHPPEKADYRPFERLS